MFIMAIVYCISMGNTTIQISTETKKKLDDRGKKGQTYDEILQELLE